MSGSARPGKRPATKKPRRVVKLRRARLGAEPDDDAFGPKTATDRINAAVAASMFAWSLANGGKTPVFKMVARMIRVRPRPKKGGGRPAKR